MLNRMDFKKIYNEFPEVKKAIHESLSKSKGTIDKNKFEVFNNLTQEEATIVINLSENLFIEPS